MLHRCHSLSVCWSFTFFLLSMHRKSSEKRTRQERLLKGAWGGAPSALSKAFVCVFLRFGGLHSIFSSPWFGRFLNFTIYFKHHSFFEEKLDIVLSMLCVCACFEAVVSPRSIYPFQTENNFILSFLPRPEKK